MPRAQSRIAVACVTAVVAMCASPALAQHEKLVYQAGDPAGYPSAGYVAYVNGNQWTTQQIPGMGFSNPGPGNLALSPNGQAVAYSRGGSLYTRNLNTGQETLVYSSTCAYQPRFTPDATALFFTRNCGSRTYADVWRVNLDGSAARALIAWVANSDGTNPRQVRPLTSQPYTAAMNASFTPDMTRVAFVGWVNGYSDLFAANVDGTGAASNLTSTTTIDENHPRWAPNGNSFCATRTVGLGSVNENGGIALYTSSGEWYAGFGNGPRGSNGLECSYRQASGVTSNQYLAAQFMPMLNFDTSEKWRPLNVAMFLSERDPATGQPWHRICDATITCSGLTGESDFTLYSGNESYISTHHNANSDPDSYTSPTPACNQSIGSTQRHDCDTGAASTMYYHVVGPSPGGYMYVDYWFFYRYNQGFGNVGNHAGDWEGITVAASLSGNTFAFAEFSQHGTWNSFLRDNLICDTAASGSCGSETGPAYVGQHVMTVPAAGSHANYPRPNSSGEFDNSNDGGAPWGRNLDTGSTGACPSNVPGSPPNVCGPAVIAFPATGAQRWTDWAGRWGETGTDPVGSSSPTSPAAPSPSDHGPHFFAPWTGVSCESGALCPSRARSREPLYCHNWLGEGVAAVACHERTMRGALRERRLGRDGSFTIRLVTQDRRAATAPGLAQVLGRPLRVGERATVSGRLPRDSELLIRVGRGQRLVTAVFDHLRPVHGRATLAVRRGKHGKPAVALLHGRHAIRPTRILRPATRPHTG